jgi:proteasome lid subunit RPN8/RPN11
MAAIHLSEAHLNVMREAAAGGYPEEVCGILVGREADGDRVVTRVVPTRNASAGDRERRYEIPPADLLHEQRTARESGLRIIGFYHTHPDYSDVPSGQDLDLAWPDYVYLILPVTGGRAGRPRAWRLADDRSSFTEVQIDVPHEVVRWA